MKKIENVLNIIKKDSLLRIIIELVLLIAFFKISLIISFIFMICIIAEIIVSKENENILCIYLFLSFFDEVLFLDKINGSISRIFMIIIFIKLLIYIIKNKIKPNKYHLYLVSFFIISFLIGMITIGISVELVTTLFNIIIFIIFSMAIKINDRKEIDRIIEKICLTIIIAVFNSIIYGLITNNFFMEIEGKKIVYRFMGTYEPNFMCMYINLAILSLLTIKDKITKKIYYILFAILINAAILTVSMTGLGTLIISVIIYLIINRKNIRKELKDLIIIVVICSIIFIGYNLLRCIFNNKTNSTEQDIINENNISQESILTESNKQSVENITDTIQSEKDYNDYVDNNNINEENNKNNISQESILTESNKQLVENITDTIQSEKDYNDYVDNNNINEENDKNHIIVDNEDTNKSQIQIRIERLWKLIKNRDFDTLTSGRIPLAKTFIYESFNRPFINILFGNGPTVKILYCNFFAKNCYSHNSYIDCVYNFGIIGFCIILVFIYRRTMKNIYLNNDITDSKYCNNIKIIRIMLLMYAFALTLYTKRMFLVFFLL